MTIQQIANTIEKNKWDFTLLKTKPKFEVLAKNYKSNNNPFEILNKLIKDSTAEEIQIIPVRRNGSSFNTHIAKTITINFKKKEMNIDNTQLNALAGLSGLGLNMADIFTAKDKASEVIE